MAQEKRRVGRPRKADETWKEKTKVSFCVDFNKNPAVHTFLQECEDSAVLTDIFLAAMEEWVGLHAPHCLSPQHQYQVVHKAKMQELKVLEARAHGNAGSAFGSTPLPQRAQAVSSVFEEPSVPKSSHLIYVETAGARGAVQDELRVSHGQSVSEDISQFFESSSKRTEASPWTPEQGIVDIPAEKIAGRSVSVVGGGGYSGENADVADNLVD